jgi:hypothetical protein
MGLSGLLHLKNASRSTDSGFVVTPHRSHHVLGWHLESIDAKSLDRVLPCGSLTSEFFFKRIQLGKSDNVLHLIQ